MPNFFRAHWTFMLIYILLSAVILSGIRQVPFHPDESTNLYLSQDLDIFLTNPTLLTYDERKEDDHQQRYRLIDAPLTRYLLGTGRSIMGIAALENDWEWSKTWEENLQNSAMPSDDLLYAGRLVMTLFLLLSIVLIYIIGFKIDGRTSGLAAAFLLGLSALSLLHGRRAMAEGALLFGTTLFILSLLYSTKLPWFVGLSMAVIFNSKHSTIPLFFVGLLAVSWFSENITKVRYEILRNIFLYIGIFLLITLALNPVFWHQPIEALQTALFERQKLLTQQVYDTQTTQPNRLVENYGLRTLALFANLYIMPPSIAEVGNYLENTAASEQNYSSNPINTLFRGFWGGALLMTLTLLGIILAGIQSQKSLSHQKKIITLLLFATVLQFFGLIMYVPLPWQRYVIPLVPFICLWVALGIKFSINIIFDQYLEYRLKRNRGTQ